MKRVKITVDDKEDKFNKLHDDLLLRIINFLPTEDALRTSALSSRWRYLWQYLWRRISNIDLKFSKKHSCSLFLDLVDKLLAHHDSSDIKKFSVSHLPLINGARIHPWISEVINHNVQELRINAGIYPVESPCCLPLCLFKSQTLTVLDIDLFGHITTFGTESESSLFSVYLPSLKILKLTGLSFLNNYSVQQLFFNTPKLQQMYLIGCYWGEKVNRLIIDIPTLERVELSVFGRRYGCGVIVNAPNLTYFNCQTEFTIDFLLSNHSLSLEVYLRPFSAGSGKIPALIRLLESVKRLRTLHLTWEFSKWLNHQGTEDLPLLTNLTELVISPVYLCSSKGDVHLEKVFMLLHKTPNLQSLAITLTKCATKCCTVHPLLDEYDDRPPSGDVPGCVVNRINTVSVSNSQDNFYDNRASNYSTAISSIKYFMNHSQSLKILNVNWYHYSDMVQKIIGEIKRHPRFFEFNNVLSISDHTKN